MMRRLFTLGGDDSLVNLKFLDAGTKLTGSGRKTKKYVNRNQFFFVKVFSKICIDEKK